MQIKKAFLIHLLPRRKVFDQIAPCRHCLNKNAIVNGVINNIAYRKRKPMSGTSMENRRGRGTE